MKAVDDLKRYRIGNEASERPASQKCAYEQTSLLTMKIET
jgi:hypothetical protein